MSDWRPTHVLKLPLRRARNSDSKAAAAEGRERSFLLDPNAAVRQGGGRHQSMYFNTLSMLMSASFSSGDASSRLRLERTGNLVTFGRSMLGA